MESKTTLGKRIIWIDLVKGFAIIFVIIGHALLGFEQINAYPEYQKLISLTNKWIYSWHMPLFIFISGITYKLSCLKNNEPNYAKIRKNTLNLGLLYIIFGTLLPVLKIIFAKYVNNPVSLKELALIILMPETLMWYIWVLIIYYWIFAGLCKGKDFSIIIFVLLFCVSTVASYLYSMNMIKMLCIKNLLYCSVFFYYGLYYMKLKERIKKSCLFILGVFAVCEIVYIATSYHNPIYNQAVAVLLDQLNAFFMIECVVMIFSKLDSSRFGLLYLGQNSLIIYLLHTYFITIMRKIMLQFKVPCLISIVACTVVPLIVCIIISYIVNANELLLYLFHPIKIVDHFREKVSEKHE